MPHDVRRICGGKTIKLVDVSCRLSKWASCSGVIGSSTDARGAMPSSHLAGESGNIACCCREGFDGGVQYPYTCNTPS